jgi:predicted flap endonuclease-1-like 5' DNA nuclease
MIYLTKTLFFPWLFFALALGAFVGWRSCRQAPRLEGLGWLGYGLIAFVFGLFIAAILAIPGRLGLWFDTALHFVFWYIVGCCLGCLLSRLVLGEGEAQAMAAAGAAPLAAARLASTEATASAARPVPSLASVKPFQWQAAKAADGVTLTGYAPSEEARRNILSAAETAFAPQPVTDKLKLASGAPQGMEDMASVAFGHLAKLDRGIASLIDARYTLTGVAGERPGHDAVMRAVKALPTGYALAKVDVVAPPQPKAQAAPVTETTAPVAAPEPAAPIDGEEAIAGRRPAGFAEPRSGKADDLKRIRGIGRQNEGRLNGLGIWHFDQIAGWSADNALWVGSYLAFPGRIEREGWIAQAKTLAAGEETEFSKRVDKGLVATSKGDEPPEIKD